LHGDPDQIPFPRIVKRDHLRDVIPQTLQLVNDYPPVLGI
jgi:hypothetical protein